MRKIHWQVPFRTISDKEARIDIYDEGYDGDIVELTPAGDGPFETSEENYDDLMAPVRTQSGYIRVIDNDDLDGLIPEAAKQHYVEFVLEGIVVWCGYMKPDAYSSDWDVPPIEAEFPVVSGLAYLKNVYLDQEKDMDVEKLGSLIEECIGETGIAYESIYIPKEIGYEEGDGMVAALTSEVSRYNFFDESDSEYGDEDYQRYDAKTCFEVLEEILRLWGWTMMERGKSLYIVSTEAGEYMKYGLPILMANVDSESKVDVSGTSMQLSELHLDGDSHKADTVSGYRKITISVDTNPIEDAIPKVDKDNLPKVTELTTTEVINYPDKKDERRRIYGDGESTDGAKFHQYMYNILGLAGWEEVEYNPEMMNTYCGGFFIGYDRYTQEDLKNEDKRNYSFKEAIVISSNNIGTMPSIDNYLTLPALSLRNGKIVRYVSGAFVISANVKGIELSGQQTQRETNGGGDFTFQFRVGDKYWSGSQWTTQKVYATLQMGTDDESKLEYDKDGKILSTKTLDMPYNGADGYVIPIDQELCGEVEMVMFLQYRELKRAYLYLEDFKIEYYPDDRNWVNEKDDRDKNTYKSVIGTYTEDKEVKLIIGTDSNNGACYATLTQGGAYVTELYYMGEGKMMRPELALLGKLKRYYGRITKRLTLQVRRGSVDPLTRVVYNGANYAVTGENVDWANDTEELIITQN
jgi:hypothetical protein